MSSDAQGQRPARDQADQPAPTPHCTDGPVLCEIRVFSDAEWEALEPEERPKRAEYYEGLGWVVAIPVEHLN
jgi:hypothetical protein